MRNQPGGPGAFRDQVIGRRFDAAVRRGKFLWLPLGAPDEGASDADRVPDAAGAPDAVRAPESDRTPAAALLAHLGMSGQFLIRAGAPPPTPHVRVRFILGPPPAGALPPDAADGVVLDFADQRTFGHLSVQDLAPTPDGGAGGLGSGLAAVPEPVRHIARDLLDPALDRTALVAALRRRRTGVKRALLDQGLVSGVGNIYADEALWRARLHYARPTDTLRRAEAERLLDAAAQVMAESLAAGGTSFDAQYVDVDGARGWFTRSLAAYGRAGEACPRCGAPIRRDAFMNRSSYSCPRCQPRPRHGRW